MSKISHLLPLAAAVACLRAPAQGTFVYDQQSSTDETPVGYGLGAQMDQILLPWGQSFTPALAAIAFVRLNFTDANVQDSLGATVYVNLHSASLNGPILAATAPITMGNAFAGVTNFFFAAPVAITPGTTYFLEPVQASGGPFGIVGGQYNYPGGEYFQGGVPTPALDLWFREGIVPEPSSLCLVLIGSAILVHTRLRGARASVLN